MSDKNRVPSERECKILDRNGISSEGITVILSTENTLVLRKHKTGDEIFLHAGCRSWYAENTKNPKRLGK